MRRSRPTAQRSRRWPLSARSRRWCCLRGRRTVSSPSGGWNSTRSKTKRRAKLPKTKTRSRRPGSRRRTSTLKVRLDAFQARLARNCFRRGCVRFETTTSRRCSPPLLNRRSCPGSAAWPRPSSRSRRRPQTTISRWTGSLATLLRECAKMSGTTTSGTSSTRRPASASCWTRRGGSRSTFRPIRTRLLPWPPSGISARHRVGPSRWRRRSASGTLPTPCKRPGWRLAWAGARSLRLRFAKRAPTSPPSAKTMSTCSTSSTGAPTPWSDSRRQARTRLSASRFRPRCSWSSGRWTRFPSGTAAVSAPCTASEASSAPPPQSSRSSVSPGSHRKRAMRLRSWAGAWGACIESEDDFWRAVRSCTSGPSLPCSPSRRLSRAR
mmetsp:Transcript_3839/g.11740  ORF Transcript_3839/g.11740 Transcript_3839/m.11740 type:complete len:380 (+) Transcript_3839:2646-3785(+)